MHFIIASEYLGMPLLVYRTSNVCVCVNILACVFVCRPACGWSPMDVLAMNVQRQIVLDVRSRTVC